MKSLMKFSAVLSRDEMKTITGGGTCGYRDADGYSMCGLSRREARHMSSQGDGYHWCCDSCASNGGGASYC